MIRVGIVGAGAMAKEHIRAFSSIDGVKIIGITNRTISRTIPLANEYNIEHTFDTIDELFELGRPDLVVVAVTETSTVEILRRCLEYNIPILTEKPVGLDLSDCKIIYELVNANKSILWVGLNRRSYSSTRHALSDLNASVDMRIIEVLDQQDLSEARSLGFSESIVKNWMYANSLHLIDYFSVFSRGEINSIDVSDSWSYKEQQIVSARIAYSSGDIGFYRAVWGMPGPWMCSVTTKNIRWEMRPLENAKKQIAGSRSVTDISIDDIDINYKAGFLYQAKDIVDALRYNKSTKTVPDINEAFKSTQLVADIYQID